MSVIEQPTTTTTPEQLQVRRGADWLDEHYPGWDEKIDLTKLNLKYCNRCVLGQVLDLENDPWSYWNILRDHALDDREHGFHTLTDDDVDDWDRLTEAWRDEVTSRR